MNNVVALTFFMPHPQLPYVQRCNVDPEITWVNVSCTAHILLVSCVICVLGVTRFVLDGFPTTKSQVDLLSKFQIVPVCILELLVDESEVMRRGENDRNSPNR